jgi:signal transduction histidine kinase
MFSALIKKINTIGILPGDEDIDANKKRFVVYESILMSFGGIMWGTICLFIDRIEQSVIPFGYVVLSAINMALFSRFKWFVFTQGFQTGISLLLPFLFQWYLGGFYASGGVMIWALLSLAASLSYSNTRASVIWLIIYVLLTAFSGIYDSVFANWFPSNYDMGLSIGLISMNIAVVSSLIFVLVIFYVNENSSSYAKVKDAQQMLIQSEKLAALGQLSAGIAHEINTPLGAIKAIAQESQAMGKTLVHNLLELYRTLTPEEVRSFLEFMENHKVKNEFLTTREERPLRMVLQKDLEERGLEHASLLANKLCQINIYEIDGNLEKLIGPKFQLIVDTLHLLFLEQKNNHTTLTSVEKASRIVKALKMYLHTSETNAPDKFNLRESLDTVLTIYHNQIKHGIRVAVDVPEDIELVGYSEEIGQVWTNLIVNACQAMNFAGTLVIKAKLKNTFAHITISDTGCGIPDDIGERVFDAFYSTKKIGEGSGLGLDIVKNIVLKHNGKIYYDSKVGVGTNFHVEIPVSMNLHSKTPHS